MRGSKRVRTLAAIIFVVSAGVIFLLKQFSFDPELNEKPTDVYAISGEFPYSDGFDLELVASYRSNSPSCHQTARVIFWTAAENIDRVVQVPLLVEKGENKYQTEVALDNFHPGLCDWRYDGLSYRISGAGLSKGIFVALGPVPNKINSLDNFCKFSKIDFARKSEIIFSCGRPVGASINPALKFSSVINFKIID